LSLQPLISVIVPCFNQANFLDDALQSVFDQTYSNWECIIVNDGATDNTEKVAHLWIKKDSRFKYLYQSNQGLSSARNKGLQNIKGEYVQFLDSDDIINSDKFTESINCGQSADIIISNFKMFTTTSKESFPASFSLTNEHFTFYNILIGWDDCFSIPIHCGLFKSKLFTSIRFNEQLKAKEDWVMWLQIYQLNIKTMFIDKNFSLYRYTPVSMTQNRLHMRTNSILAYKFIYSIIPIEYRDLFFKKILDTLGDLLVENEKILNDTRASTSYRLGNIFVKNLKRITFKKY
jgi:glycosyltransferase involved in cell wall biosynthesis